MSDYQPGVITLCVPTRGRPDGCLAMWRTALDTADDPLNLQLVLYLDDDDPVLAAYHAWIGASATDNGRVKAVTGPRIVLSNTWNHCYTTADGEILWFGNDDVRFRTDGWDRRIRDGFAAVPDRIALLHGRDGIHDRNLATLGFLHRYWAEAVGCFSPPYFSSDFADLWLHETATKIGRRGFLPDVLIEHLHPAVGKADWDITHRERMARGARDNVAGLYAELAPERQVWAEKLQAAILQAANA